jgi:multiple sugar transport system permease protein
VISTTGPRTVGAGERLRMRVQDRWLGALLDALRFASLSLVALLMLVPLWWLLVTSLRTPAQSFHLPPVWLPRELILENYAEVFTRLPFGLLALNSLKITVLIVGGQLATCSLAAYAFARLRFPGRNLLFGLLMASLMVPLPLTIIPVFMIVRFLGLSDTHAALILPPALTSAFGVFLLRQFYLTIPNELEDAAKIDGASPWHIFVRIIVPLTVAPLSVLAIFAFNAYWNEFFRPLIFLQTTEKFTLPLGLVALRGMYGQGSISVILAGVFISLLPVLLVYVVAQRHLVEGITLTGIKG